ncbi:PREDICTED: uncharacterized protein LOC106746669 [Dinoponera quadriceps]|uniref:Uncharacterized protein LOC106746669 n=1 Tax=Dinoponera quadriceps TaxID=609295 RepID=A0A6P3XL07_DINQU|nr:PREDICTED: uncharacterized protein LOC106746669 [Dinoponera quadriceps]
MTEYFVDPEEYFLLILLHMDTSYCIGVIILIGTGTMIITFSELLVCSFEGMFMYLLVFGVLSLSLNLFRVFQIVSFGGDTDEFCMHFIYALIDIVYMFLSNYAAQEVTDHNDHVFVTTYNIEWYAAPLHIQRMILFLLQRGTKTFTLNIGGLITGSMESFTSVKYLMEQLQQICNELKDENEIAIIQKYGRYAKFSTIALTCKRQYNANIIHIFKKYLVVFELNYLN